MAKGFWVKTSSGNTFKTISRFFIKKDMFAWTTVADAWVKVTSTKWLPFWSSPTNPDKPLEITGTFDSTTDKLKLQGKNYHWTPNPSSLSYKFIYIDYAAIQTTLSGPTTTTNPTTSSLLPSSTTYLTIDSANTGPWYSGKVNTYSFEVTGNTAGGLSATFNALYKFRSPGAPTLSATTLSPTSSQITITQNTTDGLVANDGLDSFTWTNRYVVEILSISDGIFYYADAPGTITGLGGYSAATNPVTITIGGLKSGKAYTVYVTPTTGFSGTKQANATGYIGVTNTINLNTPNVPVNQTQPGFVLQSGSPGVVGAVYRLNAGTWSPTPSGYKYELIYNDQAGNTYARFPSVATQYTTNTFWDITFSSATKANTTITGYVTANNGPGSPPTDSNYDSVVAYTPTSIGPFETGIAAFSISSSTKAFPVVGSQGAYRTVTGSWGTATNAASYEYQIESSNDNSTWSIATTPSVNQQITYANYNTTTTSFSLGVNYAKYYRIYVRAKSSSGSQIVYASNNSFNSDGTSPGDPTSLSYTATDTTATISFTNGTAGSNTYNGVQYKIGSGGSWSSGTYTSGFQITNLVGSTPYTIYLRSINEDGLTSVGNASVSFTTSAPFSIGSATVSGGSSSGNYVTTGATLSVSVSGFTSGTTYSYQWYKSRDIQALGPIAQGTSTSQAVSTIGEYFWCAISYSNTSYNKSGTIYTGYWTVVPTAPTYTLTNNQNGSFTISNVSSTGGTSYYGSYSVNNGSSVNISSTANSTNSTINSGSGSVSVTLYESAYVSALSTTFYSWQSTTNSITVTTDTPPGSFDITAFTKGTPFGTYSARTVNLSWGSATNANSYEYQIEQSNDGSTWSTAGQINSTGGVNQYVTYANFSTTSTSASVTLLYAKYYRAYVRAKSPTGLITYATSNPVSATGTNPSNPTNLSATPTFNSVSISFTSTTSSGSNSYSGIQTSLDGSSWSTTTSANPVSILGLSPNTPYIAYLRSVNADDLYSSGTSISFTTAKDPRAAGGMKRVTMPIAFTSSSQTIWVGTNGYVCTTVDPTVTPGTTWPSAGGVVIGPFVADDYHIALYTKADATNFYVRWQGRHLSDVNQTLDYLMKFTWGNTTVDTYFIQNDKSPSIWPTSDAIRYGNTIYSSQTWANALDVTGMTIPSGMTQVTTAPTNSADDGRIAVTATKPTTPPHFPPFFPPFFPPHFPPFFPPFFPPYFPPFFPPFFPPYFPSGVAPATPTSGGGTYSTGTSYITNATFVSSATGTTPITYYWSVYSSNSSGGVSTGYSNSGTIQSSNLSTTLNIPQQSWNQATYGNWAVYSVYASNGYSPDSGTLTWSV